jgi:hypothetical protein
MEFSISAKMRRSTGGAEWWFTSVYRPASDDGKPAFLAVEWRFQHDLHGGR